MRVAAANALAATDLLADPERQLPKRRNGSAHSSKARNLVARKVLTEWPHAALAPAGRQNAVARKIQANRPDAALAPAGRRAVATGGAKTAARRAERNPWKRMGSSEPPRRGGRSTGCCTAFDLDCDRSAVRMPPSPRRGESNSPRTSTGCASPGRRFTRGYSPSPRWG
jgi:hypothetical protein